MSHESKVIADLRSTVSMGQWLSIARVYDNLKAKQPMLVGSFLFYLEEYDLKDEVADAFSILVDDREPAFRGMFGIICRNLYIEHLYSYRLKYSQWALRNTCYMITVLGKAEIAYGKCTSTAARCAVLTMAESAFWRTFVIDWMTKSLEDPPGSLDYIRFTAGKRDVDWEHLEKQLKIFDSI